MQVVHVVFGFLMIIKDYNYQKRVTVSQNHGGSFAGVTLHKTMHIKPLLRYGLCIQAADKQAANKNTCSVEQAFCKEQ